jgi:hypothetical protein
MHERLRVADVEHRAPAPAARVAVRGREPVRGARAVEDRALERRVVEPDVEETEVGVRSAQAEVARLVPRLAVVRGERDLPARGRAGREEKGREGTHQLQRAKSNPTVLA